MTDTKALDVTTPSDVEVTITRVFDAPRALVFDAFTKPALVKRWLLGPPGWTMPVCDIDLKVGGSIRYVWRHPERGDMAMSGTFRKIERPDRLVHTELFDQDWTGGETTVTTTFIEQRGKTTVAMTILYASREARDAAMKTGMTTGMAQSYEKLDELLTATPAEKL
jgi:uncharacterized protein YndB with AHSA1/START domain